MSDVEQNPTAEPIIRLGISTCLLGEPVRYDGGHKLDRFLVDTLGQYRGVGAGLPGSGDRAERPPGDHAPRR